MNHSKYNTSKLTTGNEYESIKLEDNGHKQVKQAVLTSDPAMDTQKPKSNLGAKFVSSE